MEKNGSFSLFDTSVDCNMTFAYIKTVPAYIWELENILFPGTDYATSNGPLTFSLFEDTFLAAMNSSTITVPPIRSFVPTLYFQWYI